MANPILRNSFNTEERVYEGEPMTISGAINKTLTLLALVTVSAGYSWYLMASGFTDKASMLCLGGAVAGFILALVIIFSRGRLAPVLSPFYAIGEGFFIGGISSFFEAAYSGIVMQAVAGTLAALLSMLLLYRAKVIQCTDKFRAVLFTATMSIGVIYLIQIIASLFGRGIPQIFTSSAIGIGFSVVVVLIAAFNLIVDFDFIEKGAENMLPKAFEWYGAFGLMVTLIWLYLEILRLLAKLADRN
ncbi:MAG: Bax inhibitor-1/YccA family protein [Brachyspira sp.]|nr:Bax inhibitor-1/YccA family protein [Brachyspira sp.]